MEKQRNELYVMATSMSYWGVSARTNSSHVDGSTYPVGQSDEQCVDPRTDQPGLDGQFQSTPSCQSVFACIHNKWVSYSPYRAPDWPFSTTPYEAGMGGIKLLALRSGCCEARREPGSVVDNHDCAIVLSRFRDDERR